MSLLVTQVASATSLRDALAGEEPEQATSPPLCLDCPLGTADMPYWTGVLLVS